jgi:hypothetical protein
MRKRIAVLADIHVNVWALDAVLADLPRQGADAVSNLGDILHGVLRPRATYDLLLLREAGVALTIRGAEQQRRADPKLDWMIRDWGPEAIWRIFVSPNMPGCKSRRPSYNGGFRAWPSGPDVHS